MKRINFILVLMFSIITPAFADSTSSEPSSDYDQVCQYFNQLQTLLSKRDLNSIERGEFITDRVNNNLKPNSDARALWNVIIYAVPEERYEMFKITASEQTNTSWDCIAMKELAETAGE